MKRFTYPNRSQWPEILARPLMEGADLSSKVQPILEAVKEKGDAALHAFTARFDGVDLSEFRVSEAEMVQAVSQVPAKLQSAIQVARQNIARFHEAQREELVVIEPMPGVRCWRKSVGIEKVGLYIPGGSAPLFSTLLMLGVPALLAGCRQIVLCSPPDPEGKLHPAILYTAQLLGLTEVFKIGGAQAIAAMAYGTETVPRVHKIFGPGNQYVTLAKQLVGTEGVAIDMPAGPSELAIIADSSAHPDFIAADLLSQAEHGEDSHVLLASDSEALLDAVDAAVKQQLLNLPRSAIAQQALAKSSSILLAEKADLVELINAYAPEHLILSVEANEDWANQIINAGSVFLGHYTPESVGDYASGTNHTLPTNGHARAYSGVSLDSFVKKITFQKLSPQGLQTLGPVVETLAEAEALMGHREAVSIRLAQLSQAHE